MNRRAFLASTACLAAHAGDWPQFRGPGGQGHSAETDIPRVEVQSSFGTSLAPAYSLPSISTQRAGASGIEALSYSLAVVEKVAGPVDGILGHNFFQRFNFLLDIEHRRLWIDPDAKFSGGCHGPAPLAQNRGPVVETDSCRTAPQPPFSTSGGLLPVHLFRSVYFNHTGGYVIFNPILTTQSQANEVYFQATGSRAKP